MPDIFYLIINIFFQQAENKSWLIRIKCYLYPSPSKIAFPPKDAFLKVKLQSEHLFVAHVCWF